MTTVETRYEHVVLNEKGVPIIEGTTMKVIELVLEHIHYGWSPDELQYNHPYLTMGQVLSALAYYYDHQEELDADIKRRREFAEELRRTQRPGRLEARLKAKGLIR